jgi:geranylgeranyl diphosphate synthase, type II
MNKIDSFQNLIKEKISELNFDKVPSGLYEPMKYALTMGGKRIRPLLTLLSCDMFGTDVQKSLPAALAIEIFHNFTLVHDDIMDVAPLRRGQETVYQKWNQNIAILSGDALQAKAFEILSESDEAHLKKLTALLSKVAIEVCEGQQLDMDYESTESVNIDDYLKMIRLKTAVLTASALLAGAIVANASENDQKEIYNFGENLGLAFQIKDDILDVYSDELKFGKKKGGDIIAGKKTFLYLKAFELAEGNTFNMLTKYFTDHSIDENIRIARVVEIYDQLHVKELAEVKMHEYYDNALKNLHNISVSEESKSALIEVAELLMVREH